MQLSFHSILASNQEVDFFTDILLETDLPGEWINNRRELNGIVRKMLKQGMKMARQLNNAKNEAKFAKY